MFIETTKDNQVLENPISVDKRSSENMETSSYRQIMKATSIFGGVQVFNIFIQIIRSKAVALLLGPAGMGINGLFYSAITLVGSLTNFGLGTSAVKNIAEAGATGDNHRIAVVITTLRRWVWVTGLLGALITLVGAPWLSEFTFGNREYTMAFVWIAVTLLFTQIGSGQMVLLQGLRKLQYLAMANMTGAAVGLLVAVPIYYFLGINGIVPAIIVTSVLSMLYSWYFARKVKIEKVTVSKQTTFAEGKEMLKMGFMLSFSALISTGVGYLLGIFISNTGGVDQVGLYNAGFAIINTYVGMVFTAMGTDYYPRLSGVAADNAKACRMMNQQAEIALLILAPILTIFLVYIHWVVILLYSQKFVEVSEMLHWAVLGMFFKAASWSVAFIFLAKGAIRFFFWNELITNIYLLGFNVLGYHYGGLDGLGISFLVTYVVYFIQVFLIAKIKYQFSFDKELKKIMTVQLLLGTVCFLIVKLVTDPLSYAVGSVIVLVSGIYSFRELNKKMDLKAILNRFKR